MGKNPGDVWHVPTARRPGRRLAVLPEPLVERIVRAGCPQAVCTECRRPWQRPPARAGGTPRTRAAMQPGCSCQAVARRGLVLDPFLGSGTTAVVAQRLRRDWLGIELNPALARTARRRLRHKEVSPGRAT